MTRGRCLILLLTAFLPFPASAQLAVSVSLSHTTVLRRESCIATITVKNDSDVPFVIRSPTEDKDARVSLMIDKGSDRYAAKLMDGPLVPSLALLPEETQSVRVDVERWYDISTPQGYTLWAVAEWSGKSYASALLRFDVVGGLPVTAVTRGLPGESEHLRRYALRYLTRERSEHLFICIDENDGLVNCGVFDLGPVIRVFQPRLDVGREGAVTVLHQSANGRYVKSLLKSLPDRVTLVEQSAQKGIEKAEGGKAEGGKAEGGEALPKVRSGDL